MSKLVAIIPARGGSKGLSKKNLRKLAGIPLIAHTISAALECPEIDRCLVSTEDEDIKETAVSWGAEVIDRPDELASDNALTSDAVAHVLGKLREEGDTPEYFLLLQPTSPCRTSKHIKSSIDLILSSQANAVISVREIKSHPFKSLLLNGDYLSPLHDIESLEKPRQLLPKCYQQNGAIYIAKSDLFLSEKSFFISPVIPFIMSEEESIDIDTEKDFQRAEKLINTLPNLPKKETIKGFSAMPRLYGKPIDMKQLSRTLTWQLDTAAEQRAVAERYYAYRLPPIECCPICKKREIQPFATIYDYSFAECKDCGNIFMRTPPDPASIAKLYTGNEDDKCIQGKIYINEDIFQNRVTQIAKPKVAFVEKIISTKGKWMDIGCGTGELLIAARDSGWDVFGIEADSASRDFGRNNGLEIHAGFVPSPKFNNLLKDVSVVSLINVLEHVVNPVELLTEIVEHLPSEAHVVFEVPRHPSISSFANLVFPGVIYRHIYPPDHLNIFTEKAIERMLETAGIRPKAAWNFGQDFQGFVNNAAAAAGLEKTSLLDDILNISPKVQQVLDESGLSDAIIIIAQKQ